MEKIQYTPFFERYHAVFNKETRTLTITYHRDEDCIIRVDDREAWNIIMHEALEPENEYIERPLRACEKIKS